MGINTVLEAMGKGMGTGIRCAPVELGLSVEASIGKRREQERDTRRLQS